MRSPSTPDPSPPPSDDAGGRITRARERRAVRWGFALSIALHLVAIALYPILMDQTVPEVPRSPDETPDEVLPGFEIITMREAEETPAEPPPVEPPIIDLPEEEEEALVPLPELPAPPEVAPPAEEVVAEEVLPEEEEEEVVVPRTLAERLQPGVGDPRLWSYLLPGRGDLTDSERANLLLEGVLEAWNDSVAVAAALSDQAQDWTFTDEEGRRWGLSPGRLHLGEFSIPLPITFEAPPGLHDNFGQRQWEIDDILRGITSQQIRETWAQRAQEIRERMDAERERNRSGGGG
jgi:hypothetical protein